MSGCYPTNTPIDSIVNIGNKEGRLVDKRHDQRLIGKLIYLSHSRPEISFVVMPPT